MAVCYNGSQLVSFGWNKPKTESSVSRVISTIDSLYDDSDIDYLSPNRHAEVDAMKKIKAGTPVDTIVVIRYTKNGDIACAKPCNICKAMIRARGIKTIIYSDHDGNRSIYKLD